MSELDRLLYPTFFELVREPTPKKFRRCNKCGIKFLSKSFGNRNCGRCVAANNRASVLSSEVYQC